MTDEEKRHMKAFEAKVRQFIEDYRNLKQENADLYTELERKDEEIQTLKSELRQVSSDYANLKVAKMIEISDTELKQARQRIAGLIREVTRCIALLNSEE